MTIFDIIIVAAALIALATGFRAGLLRSLATIVAYLVAAPVAVVVAPKVAPYVLPVGMRVEGNGVFAAVVLLVVGMVLSLLMRSAVAEIAGDHVGLADRVMGMVLGVLRVLFVAVLMVAIFERIIPANRQPPWLTESKLRPLLSAAAQAGLRTLPPQMIDYIDRMQRGR